MTSLSFVISSATFWRGSAAKRTSRLVRMPTSLPAPLPSALSTTGTPEMRWRSISDSASASVASGADGDRIHHHAAFIALHPADLLGLLLDGQILMDHAHAAGLGHGDGQARFGHRVHGGGNQGNAQLDRLGQAGLGIDLAGEDFGGAGHQENIVEGQGFADGLAGCISRRPSWSAEPVSAVP